jgi:hypothetical protein
MAVRVAAADRQIRASSNPFVEFGTKPTCELNVAMSYLGGRSGFEVERCYRLSLRNADLT